MSRPATYGYAAMLGRLTCLPRRVDFVGLSRVRDEANAMARAAAASRPGYPAWHVAPVSRDAFDSLGTEPYVPHEYLSVTEHRGMYVDGFEAEYVGNHDLPVATVEGYLRRVLDKLEASPADLPGSDPVELADIYDGLVATDTSRGWYDDACEYEWHPRVIAAPTVEVERQVRRDLLKMTVCVETA